MSVQLNREYPQGKPSPIKPTECVPIDTVSSSSLAEVLNQQSMFVPKTSTIRKKTKAPAICLNT